MPEDALPAASDTVLYSVDDGAALITLNRPHAMNAVTMAVEQLVDMTLGEADRDPAVRCIVITGTGKGFCAGDDIKVQWSDDAMKEAVAALGTPRVALTPMVEVLLQSNTPTIAAVNGPAIGWGMDLALMCDLRIASTSARFSQGYVRMGLVPDIAGFWVLPRLVGPAMGAQLLLTGETVDAQRSHALGLMSEVVEPDALMPRALELAHLIAANPSLAVAATKEGSSLSRCSVRARYGVPLAATGLCPRV